MTDLVPAHLASKKDVHFVDRVGVMGTVVTIDMYGASPMSSVDISPPVADARAALREADDGYDAMIVKLDGAMRWTAGFPIEKT